MSGSVGTTAEGAAEAGVLSAAASNAAQKMVPTRFTVSTPLTCSPAQKLNSVL